MASKSRNPVLMAYKHTRESRNIRQNVQKENNGLRKDARANEVTRRRIKNEDILNSSGLSQRNGNVCQKTGNLKAVDKRKMEMLAWKTKRDKQRQIAAKNGKFVVKHVNHSPPRYLIGKENKQTAKTQKSSDTTRVTRSKTRAIQKAPEAKIFTRSTTKATQKVLNAKMITRSTKPVTKKSKDTCNHDNDEVLQKKLAKPETGSTNSSTNLMQLAAEPKAGYSFQLIPTKAMPTTFSFQSKVSAESPLQFAQSSGSDPISRFNESVALGKVCTVGVPGKTPKKSIIPKHLKETETCDGFTPRRIKSSSHFKRVVEDEENKLVCFNELWNTVLSENILTDEVSGTIRTVIGQAQLLMDQRFKQFRKLIALHQLHGDDKDATAQDLAGFWEMIFFQIEDVHRKFSELTELKNNGWKEQGAEQSIKKKVPVKKNAKNTSKAALHARQEATRKFKQAMKAKMQAAKSESGNSCDMQIVTGEPKILGKETSSPIVAVDVLRSTSLSLSAEVAALKSQMFRKTAIQSDISDQSSSSNNEMSSDSLDEEVTCKPKTPSTEFQSRRRSARIKASTSLCTAFSEIYIAPVAASDHVREDIDTTNVGFLSFPF